MNIGLLSVTRKSAVKSILMPLFVVLLVYLIGVLFKYYGLRFTCQQTGSMPEGIYIVYPAERLSNGDNILFKPHKKVVAYMIKKRLFATGYPSFKANCGKA